MTIPDQTTARIQNRRRMATRDMNHWSHDEWGQWLQDGLNAFTDGDAALQRIAFSPLYINAREQVDGRDVGRDLKRALSSGRATTNCRKAFETVAGTESATNSPAKVSTLIHAADTAFPYSMGSILIPLLETDAQRALSAIGEDELSLISYAYRDHVRDVPARERGFDLLVPHIMASENFRSVLNACMGRFDDPSQALTEYTRLHVHHVDVWEEVFSQMRAHYKGDDALDSHLRALAVQLTRGNEGQRFTND